MHEAPVRQDQNVLAIIGGRLRPGRIDDDRTIVAHGLLQAGVAVVPVGAGLPDREFVDEGLARLDAREADPRDAVHLERQQNAMPVDRGVLVQRIGHRQACGLTLAKSQQRCRQKTIDGHGMAGATSDGKRRMAHRQVDVRSDERRQFRPQPRRSGLRPGRHEALQSEQATAGGGTAKQGAAIQSKGRHQALVLA